MNAARACASFGRAAALVLGVALSAPAWAQSPAPAQTRPSSSQPAAVQALARDLQERVEWIDVSARDSSGQSRSVSIPLTVYRPPGEGPFPLAVINHGRGVPEQRRQMGRARFELMARYLVDKGFVVAVPTRIGYGPSFGSFDPEAGGACRDLRFEVMADAAADQVLASVEHLRRQPWVDASRWLVIGQSVGGLTALATAARNPPGLVGAINFAGGAGGNPERRAGNPCAPDNLAQLWRARAATASAPTLWLYWANDLYWGDQVPLRWAAAWAQGGGQVELHQLSAFGKDGHVGMTAAMDQWVPLVETWLAARGMGRPRPPWPTVDSGYARIDDLAKLPQAGAAAGSAYQRFLAAPPPRALALGSGGAVAWSRGDWAPGRALALCQRRSPDPCALYAIDSTVVWSGPASLR